MDLSQRARYRQLQEDDEEYSDSPTFARRPPELLQRLKTGRSIGPYIVVPLCTAFLTFALLAFLAPTQAKSLLHPFSSSPILKSYPPDFPSTTIVDFQPDSRFTGPGWETAYDRIGLNTFPYPGGFIAVPNPQQYNLSGGVPLLPLNGTSTPQGKYCLSVFHQLHCLKMLRMSLQSLMNGKPRQAGGGSGGFTEHEDHCFEYIRLALMCAADVTVERPRSGGADTDGWGTRHVCRRWEDVEGWAREKAYTKWWDWERFPSGSAEGGK